MPEITSPDVIRAKLQEFDQLLAGGVEAGQALERVKADSESLVALIADRAKSSEALLAEIQGVREVFVRFEQDTLLLKDRLKAALEECAQAQQLVQQKLEEAERRLLTSVTAALDAQKAALSELDSSTRVSAQAADQAKAIVLGRSAQVESLVASTKTSLESEIRQELLKAERHLNSRIEQLQATLQAGQQAIAADFQSRLEDQTRATGNRLEEFQNLQEDRRAALAREINGLVTRLDALVRQLKSRSLFTGVK